MAKSNRNLNDIFQDTANAIRAKTGASVAINPRDFADEIDSIPSGSDELGVGMLERSISEISNNTASKIGPYAFYYNTTVTSVNLPACTSIGSNAFAYCSNLSSISFPNCKRIEAFAFSACSNSRLTTLDFPECEYVADYAFRDCYNVIEISFPKAISVGGFYNCSKLTSVYLPNCTNLMNGAFCSCSNLVMADIPNCRGTSMSAFADCRKLESITMPYCSRFGTSTFRGCSLLSLVIANRLISISATCFSGCTSLSQVYFPAVSNIQEYAFYGCNTLESIYFPIGYIGGYSIFYNCTKLSMASFPNLYQLSQNTFVGCRSLASAYFIEKSTNVIALNGTNAFNTTPMSNSTYLGYFGSIFVHPSKVEAYKSATNWVTYSDRIAAAPSEIVNKGIWAYEFYSDTSLVEVPSEKTNVNYVGKHAFDGCVNLQSVNFPECEAIAEMAFFSCSNLSFANVLSCKVIAHLAFMYCYKLTSLSLPNCVCVYSKAFSLCTHLESLYLLGSSVAWGAEELLGQTPMSNSTYLGYYGSIYVRASLLSKWQSAPGWSTYRNRMVGLTDEEIAIL